MVDIGDQVGGRLDADGQPERTLPWVRVDAPRWLSWGQAGRGCQPGGGASSCTAVVPAIGVGLSGCGAQVQYGVPAAVGSSVSAIGGIRSQLYAQIPQNVACHFLLVPCVVLLPKFTPALAGEILERSSL
jgi:hypothetical protein